MSNLVVGIRPGSRYAGVSVCIDDEVLEAVTVEGPPSVAKPTVDPATGMAVPGSPVTYVDTTVLVTLAQATWQAALDIIRDHADTIRARCTNPRPLVVVEAVTPAKRAPLGKGRVAETLQAQMANQGALAMLLSERSQDLVMVPSDDFGKRAADSYPAELSGPQPQGWRGRKGSDREVQRAAWAIGQAGLVARGLAVTQPARDTTTVVEPATPQEFVAAIRRVVRNTKPTTYAELLTAAQHALNTVPRPAGVPDLTPLQVARDAVKTAGDDSNFNLDGLTAFAESAGM